MSFLPRCEGDTLRYRVFPGETLWSIAARMYGDERLWADLGALNRIGDPNDLGRITLLLPEVLAGRSRLDETATLAVDLGAFGPRRFAAGSCDIELGFAGSLTPLSPSGAPVGRQRGVEAVEPLIEATVPYLDPRDGAVRMSGGLAGFADALGGAASEERGMNPAAAAEFRFAPRLVQLEAGGLRYRGFVAARGRLSPAASRNAGAARRPPAAERGQQPPPSLAAVRYGPAGAPEPASGTPDHASRTRSKPAS